MKNIKIFKFLILSITFNFLTTLSFGSKRIIQASGIIIDSGNFKALENVKLFDGEDKLLGISDANGYFSLSFETHDKGEINFKLKLKKEGYETFVQKEHWGDLDGMLISTFYFGMKNRKSKASKAFSELNPNNKDTDYETLKNGVVKIVEKSNFEKVLEGLKSNNEKVYFMINNQHFIVNNTGWIELQSDQATVLVDRNKKVLVKDLNTWTKRSSIKYMSSTNNANTPVEIFTK